MSVTAKQIAKMMNISEAAVSMALNNKKGVSEKLRKEIIEFAKNNGYNFSKLEDKTSFNGIIAFISFKSKGAIVKETPFFEKLTNGIISACKKKYYSLVTTFINENDNIPLEIKKLEKMNLSGVILLGTEIDSNSLKLFVNHFENMVVLDTYFDTINANYVLINNIQGAYNATEYLISKYHTQPGYMKSSYSINNFEERSDGFYKAIRRNGLPTSKSLVIRLSPSIDGSYYDMLEILNNNEILSRAYFADNDMIALGAIKALEEKGYKIPDDIAIVGFDNISYSSIASYPLSTIHVEKEYLGEVAVSRLIQVIKNKDTKKSKIEISTNLIKRNS